MKKELKLQKMNITQLKNSKGGNQDVQDKRTRISDLTDSLRYDCYPSGISSLC